MTDLIDRLLTCVSLLLTPRGAHRRVTRRRTQPTAPPMFLTPPPAPAIELPVHRSPYGLDTPLDGTATIAVRPYMTSRDIWSHGLEAA